MIIGLLRSAVAVALLSVAAAPSETTARPVRVLFIGNSLTYANDLPGMIEAVAEAAGAPGSVTCKSVAFPDFGLQEHWEHGEALRMIRLGGWTHVVLQQGPTSLDASRRLLIEYSRKFAPEIRTAGAQIVFYGVWPPASRAGFFDAVTASYTAAAGAVDGLLVPVGEGWQQAWRSDPALAFYGPDGFHPSALGSYIASLMLYEALAGGPIPELPDPGRSRHPGIRSIALTGASVANIHSAAALANRQRPR